MCCDIVDSRAFPKMDSFKAYKIIWKSLHNAFQVKYFMNQPTLFIMAFQKVIIYYH